MNYIHEYGLYPVVTEEILSTFECLKCSKVDVIAETQCPIGPYRGDYLVFMLKHERNKDDLVMPIVLLEETTKDKGYDVKPLQEDIITKFVSGRTYNYR